jgi:hypothetical protein
MAGDPRVVPEIDKYKGRLPFALGEFVAGLFLPKYAIIIPDMM